MPHQVPVFIDKKPERICVPRLQGIDECNIIHCNMSRKTILKVAIYHEKKNLMFFATPDELSPTYDANVKL